MPHHRRTKPVAKSHTYYRYVAEELAGADVAAHVAEPAETAFARGRKQHAKTELLLGIFTRRADVLPQPDTRFPGPPAPARPRPGKGYGSMALLARRHCEQGRSAAVWRRT